jgi:WD40 repeat protein
VFSPDGRRLFTRHKDNRVRCWSVPWQGESTLMAAPVSPMAKMVMADDGSHLMQFSDAEKIAIRDAQTGKLVADLSAPESAALFHVLSPGGKALASLYSPGMVRLWDVATRTLKVIEVDDELQARKPLGTGPPPRPLVFSPDAQFLAVLRSDDQVQVHEVATGKLIARLHGHEGRLSFAAFFFGERRLATSGLDNTIRIWKIDTGAEVARLPTDKPVLHLAISPDNRSIAAINQGERSTQIWDVKERKKTTELRTTKMPERACFADDYRRLATLSKDGTLTIWDCETGRQLLILNRRNPGLGELCYEVSNRQFVTISPLAIREIWDGSFTRMTP